MKPTQILNRIESYKEYSKKISDYEKHIKFMVGKPGMPMPLRVMIVSGDKGVGKTYKANEVLRKQKIRKYKIVSGSLSAVQLYKFMWEHPDEIIVLDDVNSILQDAKDGASLLKAATDSYSVRTLSWQKQNPNCIGVNKFNLEDNDAIADKMTEIAKRNKRLELAHEAGKTFPDMFFFTGSLIILTNKPLSAIDKVTEGAVSNRGWHQEMLFTVDGALDLIKNVAETMTEFGGSPIQKKTINKTVKFLTSKESVRYMKSNGKLPTIRTLGKLALECEDGQVLDADALANNTEAPAY